MEANQMLFGLIKEIESKLDDLKEMLKDIEKKAEQDNLRAFLSSVTLFKAKLHEIETTTYYLRYWYHKKLFKGD
mgnify:CR=1 FL=1